MEEDVLGTLRTVTRTAIFVPCSRCGKMTPRSQARIVDTAVLEDTHSEFSYICHECDHAIKAGEVEATEWSDTTAEL